MNFAETAGMRWLLLVLAVVSPGVVTRPAVKRSGAIRIVVDRDYAPYSFLSDQDRPQGIVIDQWRVWEKKTGIRAEIRAMDWAEALRRMRAGDFDVIDSIIATDDRRKYFDFSSPYATVDASIFFRNDITGITDLASLKGFPVGGKAGDQHIDRLRERGVTTVLPFRNNGEIIKAAKQHKINVFVMDVPSAVYLLNRNGLAGEFRRSAPIFHDQLRRAVRKGDAETLNAVSRGFAAIEPAELTRIDQEWFGHTINAYERYFIYAADAAAAALLLIAGLLGWNRMLSRKILQRTAALAESEQRFRKTAKNVRLSIDTIPAMVWCIRADGGLEFVNRRWLDYTGLSFEEAIEDPTRTIHPEDRPRVMEEWLIDRTGERSSEDEMRLRRADGEYRWFLIRTVPLREQGKVVGWYGTSIDIEDRKRTEEMLARSQRQSEEAQRMAHVGSWNWDIATDAVTWSDELYRIFGLPRRTNLRVEAIALVHADDRDLLNRTLEHAKSVNEACEIDYRIRRSDGEERVLHTHGNVAIDEGGSVVRMFGATQDVTELRRAEDELRATSEQLRALSGRLHSAREEEGIRIAREIHDELGAELTSLRWELEGVKKAISEPGPVLPSGELTAKLAGMLALTDAMITSVRRIASDLRPVVLDVLGLEEAIVWQAQQFQERTGIAVHCESGGRGFQLDPAQSTAVFRIFQEALTNILRHSHATKVDVTVVEDSGVFVLMIGDNGRGITEGERMGELSIGLLGMRERAHLIGGEIDVSGVAGEGTTVTLRLPIGGA
jgi:PAS domain S-box-containing protein